MHLQIHLNLITRKNQCPPKTLVSSCPVCKYLDNTFSNFNVVYDAVVNMDQVPEVFERLRKIQEICLECQKNNQKTK